MRNKTMATDLTEGSIVPLLLRFTFPLFLSNALQTVYNLVDTIVVGRFVGNAGLSAVSGASPIIVGVIYYFNGSWKKKKAK